MNDLDQLLTGARDAIADATGPLDERTLSRVRGTVRRARIQRHAVTSVGAAACAGVLGTGVWYGIGQLEPTPTPPAHSPSQTLPSPAPSSDPTTPAAPVTPAERAKSIDDATVIERLSAPRTGETWTAPVLDDAVASSLLPADRLDTWSVYRVGERGGATLYLATEDVTTAIETPTFLRAGALMYEVDDDGARLVTCPSARTGDPCVDAATDVAAGVTVDEDTFYDTLTLPSSVDLGEGWKVSTDATRESDWFSPYGVPVGLTEQPVASIATVGSLTFAGAPVAAPGATGLVEGLSSAAYAWRLPFGSYVQLDSQDVPGTSFDDITWDDGVSRTDEWRTWTAGAGALSCMDAQFSLEDSHDPADWRRVGTTADGLPVMAPVAGGNDLSRTVRQHMLDKSWTMNEGSEVHGLDAGYPYATDDAFLEAQALIAVQAPDGTWHVRLRADALNVVFECA
ncbi:hypothetical protein [Cellulomonas gilvus]|uniref:Uncharacterized protein n=1 Tax=Cellulomonas gilvus (strain ATCC 13127 / NRRL B-14078) TaxID=593907 RepID=F8A4S8_CELGA|nr:hypothetical protein [Cellulomonas gilvus]AEI10894.1 hypothetical protein Celgi_0372 [Cellulomonas gilvus ATCC 13127]